MVAFPSESKQPLGKPCCFYCLQRPEERGEVGEAEHGGGQPRDDREGEEADGHWWHRTPELVY